MRAMEFLKYVIAFVFLCIVPEIKAFRSRLVMMGGGPIRGDAIPKLIKLIADSDRGARSDKNCRTEIINLIKGIEEQQAGFIARDAGFVDKCNGKWSLLWTTEKETLLFQKSGLFGSPVTEIFQTIDTRKGQVINSIQFENNREFTVYGTLSPDASDRTRLEFKFSKASIVIPPFVNLSIPPVGQGWFKNVFCNTEYRLSRDIRGDYLVSKRSREGV